MLTAEPQGCLTILLQILGMKPAGEKIASGEPLPYSKTKYFFSQAERKFFSVLQQILGHDHLIFAKVRLADLVQVTKGTDKWQTHFNRIKSKHVDFVICSSKLIEPELIIELDDASHEKEDRQERDNFLDEVCQSAGITILHIKPNAVYNISSLTRLISQHLK